MLKTVQNETISIHNDIPAIYISGNRQLSAVIMAHGIMGSKNEYLDTQARIAEKLENQGIASLRIDFCGHGDSLRCLSDFSLSSQIQDLSDAIRWLQNKGYTSIVLLGVSFGAPPVLITSVLFSEVINKSVLIAPVIDYKKTFVFPSSSWGIKNFGIEKILNGIQCSGLNLDENYILSSRVLTDILLVDVPTFINMKCADLNISIFHGDCDDMVPYSISKEICDSSENIKLFTMKNTEHGLTEVGDEEFSSSVSLKNLNNVVLELQ